MRAWWLVAIVAACGDNLDEVGEGVRDGSRIKVRWFEFEDGTRQWEPEEGTRYGALGPVSTEVFYDAELRSPCTPQLWSDGTKRCVPPAQINNELKLYADAACSMRVTPEPRDYRFVGEYDVACNEPRVQHIYSIDEVIVGGAVYARQPDGRCAPWFDEYEQLGVVGAEIPATRFATMTTSISDDDDRIHVRYEESDDGMRVPIGLYDSLLGPADLRSMYARPKPPSFAIFYSDAQCDGRVVQVETGCTPPATAYWGEYAPVRERVAVTSVYAGTGIDSCELIETPPGDYYRVDSTWFPIADMVTTTDDVPGRRLQLRHAYIGPRPVRTRELVDTQLAIACKPFEFPDGVHRCTQDPELAYLDRGGAYADATCETSIEIIYASTYDTTPTYVIDDRRSSSGALRVFEIGARIREPHYRMADVCRPFSGDEVVYRVGAEVAWDTFARATLTMD